MQILFSRELGQINYVFRQNLSVASNLALNNNPQKIIDDFPAELLPNEGIDTFEKNILMHVIPLALRDKDQEIKNDVLRLFLQKGSNFSFDSADPYWVVALVEAGADPNLVNVMNIQNIFPLAFAAKDSTNTNQKHYDYAKALLRRKADTNKYFLSGESCDLVLDTAKTVKFAKLLVDHGAQLNPQRLYLHDIVLDVNKEPALLHYFIKDLHYDVNETASNGTALHDIVKYGSLEYNNLGLLEKARILLDNGADIQELKDERKNTILDYLEGSSIPEFINSFNPRVWNQLKELILGYREYLEEVQCLSRISI